MLEAKHVAQRQVAEAMLNSRDQSESASGDVLYQGGTSMYHRHFQSFQITTVEGEILSAVWSEVARGDASSLFDEFNNLVSEQANSIEALKSYGRESASEKVRR